MMCIYSLTLNDSKSNDPDCHKVKQRAGPNDSCLIIHYILLIIFLLTFVFVYRCYQQIDDVDRKRFKIEKWILNDRVGLPLV